MAAVADILIRFGEKGAGVIERRIAGLERRLRGLQAQVVQMGALERFPRGGRAVLREWSREILEIQRRIAGYRRVLLAVGGAKTDLGVRTTRLMSAFRGVTGVMEGTLSRAQALVFSMVALGGAVIRGTIKLGELGARSMVARAQFETTAATLGTTADALLPRFEEATLGTISATELMRLSNFALATGLRITEDQILKLSEASIKLGLVQGKEAPEAMRRLIFGITKCERRILDDIAIILDARDAFKAYADGIEGATSELDRQAKIQAFLEFVLRAVDRQLASFVGVNWEAAAAGGRLTKVWEDFLYRLGEIFIQSGAAQRLVDALRVALDNLLVTLTGERGRQFFDGIAEAVVRLIPLMEMLANIVVWLAANAEKLVRAFIGLQIGKLIAQLALPLAAIGGPWGVALGLAAGAAPLILGGVGWLTGGGGGATGREIGRAVVGGVRPALGEQREMLLAVERTVRNGLYQPGVSPGAGIA